MVKKKINVIDLDQTLIPYDSYSEYLNRLLLHPRYFISGIVLILLRKLRIISLSTQKKYSVIFNQRIISYEKYVNNYAEKLSNHLNNNVMEMVKDRLGANPLPIVIPIGSGEMFTGVIDLLSMKAILYNESTLGSRVDIADIPDDMLEGANKWRKHLIEETAT